MSTIGDRISAVRKAKGLTQADVGKAVNLTSAAISLLEKGKSTNLETIYLVADFLECSRDWIVNEVGAAPEGVLMVQPVSSSDDVWKDTVYKDLKDEISWLRGLVSQLTGNPNFLTALDNTAGAIVVELFPAGALSGAQVA